MKKPRSDSPLQNLPEEQAAKLCDWMLSGLPYHKVKKLVKEEFSLETSEAALSRFYSSFCAAALLVRRSRAVTTAAEIAEEAAKTPGQFDAATIDALKQKAFELSISPQADPGDVKDLFMLVLKAKDQEMDEKKLHLELEKFKSQEERKARELNQLLSEAEPRKKKNKGGNNEPLATETINRIRDLYGLSPIPTDADKK